MFGWFNRPPTDHVDEIVGLARAEHQRISTEHYHQRRADQREEETYQALWRVKGELHTAQQELKNAQAHTKALELMILRMAGDRRALIELCGKLVDQSTDDEAERALRYEQAQAEREQLAMARLSDPAFVTSWGSDKLRFNPADWMPQARHKIGKK